MNPEAILHIFRLLAIVWFMIVLGFQVYWLNSLKTSGEIGYPRFLSLLAVVFLSAALVIAGVTGARPWLYLAIFAPAAGLLASLQWEERFWNRRTATATRREIAEWEEILGRAPDHETACSVLGDLHRKLGETEKAARCYRRALELGADTARLEAKLADLAREPLRPPSFSPRDWATFRRELGRFPRLFLAFAAGLVMLPLLFYLLHRLPAWLTFVILVVLPVALFVRWLLR